jgi:hypothetical protein
VIVGVRRPESAELKAREGSGRQLRGGSTAEGSLRRAGGQFLQSRMCLFVCDLDVLGNLVRPVRLLNTKFHSAPEDMDEKSLDF